MTPTYQVRAERSGRWWAIEIPEVPNAVSQARRIDQIEDMAREVIALLLEVDPFSFELRIELVLPEDWSAWASQLRRERSAAERAERVAGTTAREVAARLRAAGLPMRDIGAVLGVSPQRISQLMKSAPPLAVVRVRDEELMRQYGEAWDDALLPEEPEWWKHPADTGT